MQSLERLEMEKAGLRHEYLARRRAMKDATVAAACRQICERVNTLLTDYAGRSGAVLSYLAYGHEVNLAETHRELWRLGRPLAVPRTSGLPRGEMQLMYLREDTELELSPLGMREPVAGAEPCRPENLAVVLLPGVAFDAHGGRLGHGAGYYDRFLGRLVKKPLLVGVAYEWQVLPSVPQGSWDQPMDYLVTEKELRHFAR